MENLNLIQETQDLKEVKGKKKLKVNSQFQIMIRKFIHVLANISLTLKIFKNLNQIKLNFGTHIKKIIFCTASLINLKMRAFRQHQRIWRKKFLVGMLNMIKSSNVKKCRGRILFDGNNEFLFFMKNLIAEGKELAQENGVDSRSKRGFIH